jgi:hypothetical protein
MKSLDAQAVESSGSRCDTGMTLSDVRELLQAQVVWAADLSARVEAVGAADLMSDVLRLSSPGMLLLTGLASTQAIRTAAIADLVGVVLVRGKVPGADVTALARETGIPIMTTALTLFEASGLLYSALHRQ